MRRQWFVGVTVGLAIVLGLGLVVWASTQGFIGPYGKAKHLLISAERDVQQQQWPSAQAKLEQILTAYADSPFADQALLELGQAHQQQQHFVEARAAYRLLLERFPKSALLGEVQQQLGAVNVALLFSPTMTEADKPYEVKPGDTLGKIASAAHTTVELLRRANGFSKDVIRPGQKLKIPGGHFSVVVDKSQNQLLLTQDNQFFKLYPVATGKDNSTPVGAFKIIEKVPNPIWYKQGAVVPSGSAENILGTRWMGLSKQGYGIHGSTDPSGIGKQVTAGCVRMHNADVEELFEIVPRGTDVTIVD